MTLELNNVLIEGETKPLSLMAHTGKMTCMTGGSCERRTRWLLAMMGFLPVQEGFICIDGEPLNVRTTPDFRSLMAYAPAQLGVASEVYRYEPPSVQDVFQLKANRRLPISNGLLGEEMRRIDAQGDRDRVQLIAVATLLEKPIMLIDSPIPTAASYLQQQARKGKVVLVASGDREILAASDNIVELI